MAQQMTKDEMMRLGRAAGQVVSSDAYKIAVEAVAEELTNAWRNSGPHDVENREAGFRLVRALDLVTMKLESFRDSANIEKSNQEAAKNPPLDFVEMQSWQN